MYTNRTVRLPFFLNRLFCFLCVCISVCFGEDGKSFIRIARWLADSHVTLCTANIIVVYYNFFQVHLLKLDFKMVNKIKTEGDENVLGGLNVTFKKKKLLQEILCQWMNNVPCLQMYNELKKIKRITRARESAWIYEVGRIKWVCSALARLKQMVEWVSFKKKKQIKLWLNNNRLSWDFSLTLFWIFMLGCKKIPLVIEWSWNCS